jgi:hypothetical protein
VGGSLRNIGIVLLLLNGSASADAPHGTYKLRSGEGTPTLFSGKRLRTCGATAKRFLNDNLEFTVTHDIKSLVNGTEWDVIETGDVLRLRHPSKESSPTIEVWIVWKGQNPVTGSISYWMEKKGALTCGDSRILRGRHTP